MFSIGIGEILLIFVVFIVTMEHTKFKEYIFLLKFLYVKFHSLKRDILEQIGFLEKPEKYIFGDDGKKYESYDINHILGVTDAEANKHDDQKCDKEKPKDKDD